jgi:Nucleotidyl transferase AbiEii toxin, Type IV TA system
MAESHELAEDQRRALDRLRPAAHALNLYLAGGTALTFHLGHRLSQDVDLFSQDPGLDLERARRAFAALPEFEVDSLTDATLRFRIGGVPVDVVRYPYALLNPPVDGPDHFPVASLEDLATMKLSAVSRRGIRRDFWDLYEMFSRRTPPLDQALDSYLRRYGVKESDLYHVLKALTYFDDAEADALLPLGLTQQRWVEIKSWFADHTRAALGARIAGHAPR